MKRIPLIAVATILVLSACDFGLSVAEMPQSVEDMDFKEFAGNIDPSTLPTFTGTAVSQSDLETLTNPVASVGAANVIPQIVSSVNQAVFAPQARSVGAYVLYAFNIEDETVVLEEAGEPAVTVSIEELNAAMSAAAEIDQISDEIESLMNLDGMLESIGTLGADYTAQLKVIADIALDTEITGSPLSYGSWHHLSSFVVNADDVVVTLDDVTGEPDVTGTVAVEMVFDTSVGFVITGEESMNGRYIVNVSMEPIKAEVNIEVLQATIEANSGSTEEELIDAVVGLFSDGVDVEDIFRLEYGAYDNDGNEIAYVRMSLVDALYVLSAMM